MPRYLKIKPSATNQPYEESRSSTTSKPQLVMVDPPGPFDTLARWEQHLGELKKLPENVALRREMLQAAHKVISEKRREERKASR